MKTPRQLIREHFNGKLEHYEERLQDYDYFDDMFKYPFKPDISHIEELIRKAQNEAIDETIRECIIEADVCLHPTDSCWVVDSDSILQVGEQLKSKIT